MNTQLFTCINPILLFSALTVFLYILTDDTKTTSSFQSTTADLRKAQNTKSDPPAALKYDISHLVQLNEKVWGQIQDDEALFLFSIVKVIRPKVLLECGMLTGYSTVNFLKALDSDAKLFTYDKKMYNRSLPAFLDKRFKFIFKSQAEFSPADIGFRKIDFIFINNGHTFDVNVEFWKKVIESTQPNGMIVIHGSGLHNKEELPIEKTLPCVCELENLCGIEHVPAQRKFVDWLIDNYPEWEVVHFHSFSIYRHGLTFLQKKYKLSRQPQLRNKCNKNIKIINL